MCQYCKVLERMKEETVRECTEQIQKNIDKSYIEQIPSGENEPPKG